jgi:hypothetical protein
MSRLSSFQRDRSFGWLVHVPSSMAGILIDGHVELEETERALDVRPFSLPFETGNAWGESALVSSADSQLWADS